MSYSLTQNSFQSNLNDGNTAKLITQSIQDPVVQQNFEILNKVIANNFTDSKIQKANIIISPAWNAGVNGVFQGAGIIQTPGPLQIQITTRGNPVRIKVAPFFDTTQNKAIFTLTHDIGSATDATFGWYRTDLKIGVANIICQIALSLPQNSSSIPVPLPAFEFDDVVPTGTYIYQFFFILRDVSSTLLATNINVVAYELR